MQNRKLGKPNITFERA